MNSPFDIERLRDRYALQKNYSAFRKTYSSKYPEIKNINNKLFWDEKISDDRKMLKNYPMYKDKIKTIVEYLSNQKGSVLDIGFGWASLEEKIQDFKDLQIYGVDISSEAVGYARRHLSGEYKVGSVYKLRYPEKSFDYVVALDVLEHIPPSRIFGVYKTINKIIKKGGKLLITVPINERLEEMIAEGINPIGHVRKYSPGILKAELALNGYEIIHTEFLYAFNNFYSLKKLFIKICPFMIREPNLALVIAKKK